MTLQPCTSIGHFIHGLDTYLHPEPSKRQKNNPQWEYTRIEPYPLNSFLNVNSHWLSFAKTNPTVRQKFRDLAADLQNGISTRQKIALGKRLREEGRPQLPPEMFQEILNIASYSHPSELIDHFRQTLTIASSWPSLSQHALITKINAQKLRISSLQIEGGFEAEFRFILSCGAKLTYLDLSDRAVNANHLVQIFEHCKNLSTLKINAPGIQRWDSTLDTISDLTRLETFHATFNFLECFRLPEMPALKSLDLSIVSFNIFGLPEQIETLSLKIESQTSFDMPELPQLKKLTLSLPHADDLTLPEYPLLRKLKIYADDLDTLHLPTQPSLRTCLVNSTNLRQLTTANQPLLDFLVIDADEITHLKLPSLPSLCRLIMDLPALQELTLAQCARLIYFDLTSADLREFPVICLPKTLDTLSLSLPQITSLTLEKLSDLTVCELITPQLNNLTLAALPSLESLTLETPALHALKLQNLPCLDSLLIDSPLLAALTFEGVFDALKSIEILSHLQSFSCPQSPVLERLYLQSNNLSALQLPLLPKLEALYLRLENAPLYDLTLPPLPKLTLLTLESTQLRHLKYPLFPLIKEITLDCPRLIET